MFRAGRATRGASKAHPKMPADTASARMVTFAFDNVPDSVKRLDELELRRRAKLAMNPPIPLSEECMENLRKAIPEIAKLDDALGPDSGPLRYDPNDHKVYSWAYMKLRPWTPNAFFITVSAVGAFAMCRRIVKFVLSKYSVATVARIAIKVDFWATLSLGCVIPLIFIKLVKGRGNNKDAILRTLAMFLSTASLMLPTAALASTGAVRAALLSSAFIRCVPIPTSLWFWEDLRRDIERSDEALVPIFRAWRFLATLLISVYGTILRTLIFLSSSKNDFFFFMCDHTVPIRLMLAYRFPVALSLLRDVGGLQFLVAVLFGLCFFYGLYVACLATDFLRIRDHRGVRTFFAKLLTRAGFYDDTVVTGSRRFISSAPPGVESYRPSSVMLLQKVEGLLGSDSALIVREETPAILDLLANEQGLLQEKNAKEWMPPRTEYVVPNEKISFDQIRWDSLRTWARPLSEEQKDVPFTQFFETLGDDEFMYDEKADDWNLMKAMSSPDVTEEEYSIMSDEEFEEFTKKMLAASEDESDEIPTIFM